MLHGCDASGSQGEPTWRGVPPWKPTEAARGFSLEHALTKTHAAHPRIMKLRGALTIEGVSMVLAGSAQVTEKQVADRARREKRRRVRPDSRVALCRSVAADVGRLVAQIGTAAQSKQQPLEF